jgi:hypothetical protein
MSDKNILDEDSMWYEVPGFPWTEVTKTGRVRSKRRYAYPVEIKYHVNEDGYFETKAFNSNNVQKLVRVHTLIALAFLSPKPSLKHQVSHEDGNKQNNHYSNLRWVTCFENMQRAILLDELKPKRGITNFNAKLTDEQVKEIRILAKTTDLLHKEIAIRFNISRPYTTELINRQRR